MRRTQTVPATEYEEVDEAPRRRIGMWILILLLLAGIGVMAWLLTSGKLDNKGSAVKVAVPSVLNMKSADAKATLEQQGFVVNLTFEQRDDVDTDIVFSQNPDGDTQADKNSTVDIIASSGGEPVELPNVIGLQQADAVAKLQGINMQTEIVTVQTEDKPEGTVLAQNPPPSQKVPEQTVVTLQVAGPPDLIEIPDVTGQDQLSAAATLGRNFQVETKQEQSDSIPVGRVISTDPPAGTKVARDTTVTMTISAGTPVTTVPDVTGLSQSAASGPADERRPSDGSAVREPVARRPTHRRRDHAEPAGGCESRRRLGRHRDHRPAGRWRWRWWRDVDPSGWRHDLDLVRAAAYLTCARKFASSWCPLAVSTDSGWNCTPSIACSRWRSPMIVPSSVSAVISSTAGSVVAVDDERVVARRLERIGQPGEHAVVRDGG